MNKLQDVFAKEGIPFYPSRRVPLNEDFSNFSSSSPPRFSKIWENTKESEGLDFDKDRQLYKLDCTIPKSLFKFFLDGTRKTYLLGNICTSEGRYTPVVAAQISVGICERTENRRIRPISVEKQNIIAIHKGIQRSEREEIELTISQTRARGVPFSLLTYDIRTEGAMERPENGAIAAIQKRLMDLEIQFLESFTRQNRLRSDAMLVLDGSLQFMQEKLNDQKIDERFFSNVIGISKSFNPSLTNVLKGKKDIGSYLVNMPEFTRSPAFRYSNPKSERVIAAWYLRLRRRKHVMNPLEGIVKIEKIATTPEEKAEDGGKGFQPGFLNNISNSVLKERNPTCFGKDSRWAAHLYPMYLTEYYIKRTLLSDIFFLNIFK